MAEIGGASKVFDVLIFYLLGKQIARQFVVFGGVPGALARGGALTKEGIVPTYNRIDEHVRDKKRIEEILSSYIEIVRGMNEQNSGNVAIKPSAFGMELGPAVLACTLARFIDAVNTAHLEIEIDAESRETLCAVQGVLNSFTSLPRGIILRPAFQMHLPEALRAELIARYRILDMPVRIVKGSGLYNVGAAEVSEKEVLERYYATFRTQIKTKKCPTVASVRDRRLLSSASEIAMALQASPREFTMQFLDGPFGRSIARAYVSAGYRVGCYVTFVDPSQPDEWKGYVKRRIAFGRKLFFGG